MAVAASDADGKTIVPSRSASGGIVDAAPGAVARGGWGAGRRERERSHHALDRRSLCVDVRASKGCREPVGGPVDDGLRNRPDDREVARNGGGQHLHRGLLAGDGQRRCGRVRGQEIRHRVRVGRWSRDAGNPEHELARSQRVVVIATAGARDVVGRAGLVCGASTEEGDHALVVRRMVLPRQCPGRRIREGDTGVSVGEVRGRRGRLA
jgi:hypothetical protein